MAVMHWYRLPREAVDAPELIIETINSVVVFFCYFQYKEVGINILTVLSVSVNSEMTTVLKYIQCTMFILL